MLDVLRNTPGTYSLTRLERRRAAIAHITMPKKTSTLTRMSATAAVAVIALTGCSSQSAPSFENGAPVASDANETNVYEFANEGPITGHQVTAVIPDDLREAAAGDAEGLLVRSYKFSAEKLSGAEFCAVKAEVEFDNGGAQLLADPSVMQLNGDQPEYTPLQTFAGRLGFGSPFFPLGGSRDMKGFGEEVHPIGDFDPSAPAEGAYVSDDYRTIVAVRPCALSPVDTDALTTFAFSFPGDATAETLAAVGVMVMRDGTVSLAGQVPEYVRDSNGDWVQD